VQFYLSIFSSLYSLFLQVNPYKRFFGTLLLSFLFPSSLFFSNQKANGGKKSENGDLNPQKTLKITAQKIEI
jgi:hypothetical protein